MDAQLCYKRTPSTKSCMLYKVDREAVREPLTLPFSSSVCGYLMMHHGEAKLFILAFSQRYVYLVI
jgi:hypothetical protein